MAEDSRSKIVGKSAKPIGETPAIGLVNPKYAHNIAGIVRTASCFGVTQVHYSGETAGDPENTK